MSYSEKTVIFIFGCQRSGTSITSASLSRLKNVKSYPETNNPLTDLDTSEPHHTIRLNPLDNVKSKIDNVTEKYVIVKPLVESQNARIILEYFPNSKAMWLYRSYRDVVSSMIEKWGKNSGFSQIEPIIQGSQTNWRSEKIAPEVRQMIVETVNENNINGADAWGLFWYARNSLLFSQDLSQNDNLVLLNYQKLVSSPDYITTAFKKLETPDIDIQSVWQFETTSVGKGKNIQFSEKVETYLNSMMDKLDFYSLKIQNTR